MELIPIGRFARLTGLTVRAVRHYGELGLLEPAYIDPDTGYRYYAPDQVEDAAAIRRLRLLELALDEIYWAGAEDLPVEKWLTEVQFPVVRDEAKLEARA